MALFELYVTYVLKSDVIEDCKNMAKPAPICLEETTVTLPLLGMLGTEMEQKKECEVQAPRLIAKFESLEPKTSYYNIESYQCRPRK